MSASPQVDLDETVDCQLVPYLSSIAKAVRQLVSLKLADCGVAPGQDQFLLCFAEGEGVPVAEIANRLAVRPSTVSKMTDHLQRNGWVDRRTDATDARRVRVHLTDAGRRMQDTVRDVEARLNDELVALLGEDAVMLPTLAKLDAVLAKRLSRLR